MLNKLTVKITVKLVILKTVEIMKKLKCWLFGHRINVFLIERTRQKKCTRCGKKIIVWHIDTLDDYLNGNI